MGPTKEDVLRAFSDFVLRWMRDDIDRALGAEAYLLAALGLVCYTEVLGGFQTGNLGKRRKTKKNFDAFLDYLSRDHAELRLPGVDFYGWVRCGLVHQYFPKSNSGIVAIAGNPQVVIADPSGRKLFNVRAYTEYFFEGARRYRDALLGGADSRLVDNFFRSLERILGLAP